AADLADDRRFVREELARRGLVAFVADGSVLPRESGVSARPMEGARPFTSPESMRVVLDLPHRGPTPGMGVRRGITLIVGGGYHGKSTLLRALQEGVYDHVAGDGRELVVTDAAAVKLRAEDGRPVRETDISLFIGELPDGRDTARFTTADASGSTSQAAAVVEALDAGSRVLLVDEDTSATNFMVRDALMEAVVSGGDEPITPFVERVRDLWERAGVSCVIVAGSSGAFFSVADTVVQMDRYEARDITDRVRAVCRDLGAPETPRAPRFSEP
ncbi:ABC-ATPase domain-containing protein, partial [Candidatus Collinsella stercoripullorum]|uniref:ABC-ATPase domain-containing protein n=1 Tax=Candidatus Collinsella stercoripullorum TaxID=2838522 RepID=UPI0022E1F9E3